MSLHTASDGTPLRKARLVVAGAGFGGASLIQNLPPPLRRPGETLLLDRAPYHTFVPLIHEVAAGRVHPKSVLSPIAPLCRGRCEFLQTEIESVDLENRTVRTAAGPIGYDYLVLSTGSVSTQPPEPLRERLHPFWSLGDALWLRDELGKAWRSASVEEGALNVVVVGGGATGVELSAELASLFDYLQRRATRGRSHRPRVILLEKEERLMGWLPRFFHEVALEDLGKLGVEVRLNATVEAAGEEGVRTGEEWLPTRIRVWTGGNEASPLIRGLPGDHDPTGRAFVDEMLTLPVHPEVYILGDAGVFSDPRRGPLPPTASVAVQQGPFVARDLRRRLRGARRIPFRFSDRGYVVSLGPESAVAEALGRKLRGAAAQALYRSIFLYYLGRRDRLLTASDWAMERPLGRLGLL
jgi:NADH dehydrogenase